MRREQFEELINLGRSVVSVRAGPQTALATGDDDVVLILQACANLLVIVTIGGKGHNAAGLR